MYKTLSMFVALFFCFSVAAAQNNLADYSESTPYQPREIEFVEPKKKKDKKSKKDLPEKKTPPETVAPANPVSISQTVRIPLFVYDKSGIPVTDLKSSDIKVFVDDAEREFTDFEAVNSPLDILLILDTSHSLAFKEKDLRNVVLKLIEALKPDDKLQIISFNQEVSILSQPTGDAEILRKAVKKVKHGDGTSIYDATQEIFRKYLSGKTPPPVVIMLTDGVDTTSRKFNYLTALVEAERSGAVVFPFYFDSFEYYDKYMQSLPTIIRLSTKSPAEDKAAYAIGKAFVQDIAALSGGRTFAVKNLTDTKKEDFEDALKFINPHYYLSINSTETVRGLQRKQIKVRVMRPNLTVYARGSYVIGEN